MASTASHLQRASAKMPGMHVRAEGRKRVLVVCFRFPPHGGGGVQRTTYFVRYLSRYGWEPEVLTGPEGDYGRLRDDTLLGLIPPDVPVWRTSHLDSRNLFRALARVRLAALARTVTPSFPLMEAGWIPYGYWQGRSLLARQRFDLIYSSAYPMSSHLVAHLLQRRTGLPWVADYRDEWSIRALLKWPTRAHERLARRIDRTVTSAADGIVVTSPVPEQRFREVFKLGRDKVVTITNGYDAPDFDREHLDPAPEDADRFRIAHVGSFLRGEPEMLLEVLEAAIADGLLPPERIRVALVGDTRNVGPSTLRERGVVRPLGYVDHAAAVAWMKSSDVLLLVNKETNNIRGKLFEYLGARRPILALVNPGPEAQIVRETGAGTVVDPTDREGIRQALLEMYRQWRTGTLRWSGSPERIRGYTRDATAHRLASYFDQACRLSAHRGR